MSIVELSVKIHPTKFTFSNKPKLYGRTFRQHIKANMGCGIKKKILVSDDKPINRVRKGTEEKAIIQTFIHDKQTQNQNQNQTICLISCPYFFLLLPFELYNRPPLDNSLKTKQAEAALQHS